MSDFIIAMLPSIILFLLIAGAMLLYYWVLSYMENKRFWKAWAKREAELDEQWKATLIEALEEGFRSPEWQAYLNKCMKKRKQS